MTSRFTGFISRTDTMLRPEGKVFYGWWIVAACSGIQWLAAMTWMHSYGAYTLELQAEFGWSMSVLSLAFALTRLESGLLGPAQGWLVDRFGPKRVLIIGTLIFGVGFFWFSQVNSIPSFFIAFILIALGSSLGGFATLMVPIVSWFDKHRSKAVAMSSLGFSVGGMCVPLVVIGLEVFGWRTMAMLSGVLVVAVGVPLSLLIYHRPADRGDVVDGIRDDKLTDEDATAASKALSFTWQQAIRTPAFWLLSIGHGLALLTVSSMLAHLIPHLTLGLGYTPVEAGLVFSLMTGVYTAGLFLGGVLGDRYDKRAICMVCMAGHGLGLLALTYADHLGWIIAFAVLHGLAWGVRGPLMVALRADYFGSHSFGTILGISSLIIMLGMTLGPIVSGVLYDALGNYQLAFTVIAGCSLLGGAFFYLARPPQLPRSD